VPALSHLSSVAKWGRWCFLHGGCTLVIVARVDAKPDNAVMEAHMRRAIVLARRAWGDTHPNPMVGALVVASDGSIVGEGWHERAGGPHAEVNALRQAGENARGGTIYVTLEPCSTQGRTPPCTLAIQMAGLARVVVGATDPNPVHIGRGFEQLRDSGIEVISGILADECEDLNLIFNHWISKGQPLFAAKTATTLCGHIAARTGDSKWITGPAAREDVHHWRRYFPAIAVGSGTVLADDPHLTVRLSGVEEFCPLRFVFDRTLSTVRKSLPGLYTDAFRERTTLVTAMDASAEKEALLRGQGVNVLRLLTGEQFWPAFRDHCVQNRITGVLFEGGSALLSSLLLSAELDYMFSYRAPMLLADSDALPAFHGAAPASISAGWRLKKVRHAVFGDDVLTRGWV